MDADGSTALVLSIAGLALAQCVALVRGIMADRKTAANVAGCVDHDVLMGIAAVVPKIEEDVHTVRDEAKLFPAREMREAFESLAQAIDSFSRTMTAVMKSQEDILKAHNDLLRELKGA